MTKAYFNRTAHLAIGVAAFAGLSGCAGVSGVAGNLSPDMSTLSGKNEAIISSAGPTDYSIEKNKEAKNLDAAASLGALDELILSMPQVERELEALLQPLASGWKHPTPNKAKVKIAMSSEYQAVTFPDGTIKISLGTLDNLTGKASTDARTDTPYAASDQELQYLLGHEFSHYALGHHNKADYMTGFSNAAKNAIGIYREAATLQRVRYSAPTANGQAGQVQVTDQRGLNNDIDKALNLYEQLDAIQKQGLAPAWNRGQEDDADALAYDLQVKAGVIGDFYSDVFENTHAQQTLSEALTKSLNTQLESTRNQLTSQESFTALLSGQQAAQQQGANIIGNAVEGLKSGLFKATLGYFGTTHRRPDVRTKGMEAYAAKVHPDAAESFGAERTDAVIRKIRSYPEFQQGKIATIAYNASFVGAPEVQAREIQKALNTQYGNQPTILLRAGIIARDARRTQQALTYFNRAIESPLSVPPRAYRELSKLHIEQGNYGQAESVIKKATSRGIDAPYFLPTRIQMALRQNQTAAVVDHLVQCRNTQRDDLVVDCEAAAEGLDPEKLTPEQRAAINSQSVKTGGGFLNKLGNLTNELTGKPN